MDKPEGAVNIIKKYEEILRTKRKGIITAAYHQRKVFSRFLEKEKFARLVANFKIHKETMIFKINVLTDSEISGVEKAFCPAKYFEELLSFLKNYFKDIKRIWQQNSSKFE